MRNLLGSARFDVIIVEPPLAEYAQKMPTVEQNNIWDWNAIENLDVGAIADTRAFIWLWCGSSPEGTSRGRDCLRRWGFRRCEDICWVKRNTRAPGKRQQVEPDALFHRTKEHCLMGIKGIVHCFQDAYS